MKLNLWLVAGGVLSAIAALLHLAIIAGGPSWYRFFGAGERMAHLAETGKSEAWLVTAAIAAVLAVWAAYAFSGAGLLPRLPLLKLGLVMISTIYLVRGLALVPGLMFRPGLVTPFLFWSSLVVIVYGLTYTVGTWQAWSRL
nr:hypothetical protein [Polymorphobacter sp.]